MLLGRAVTATTCTSCATQTLIVAAGLSVLAALMELYCGGNLVEGVREVGHVRGLQKLIIVDLSGNPMTAHDDYRLYTIYHLRKLKVSCVLMPC